MTGIIRPLDGLEKVLRYEPDTGRFFWLVDRPRKTKAGDEAGSLVNGYIKIGYKYKRYQAHRIAWFLHTGQDPHPMEVDHVNNDKTDNRFSNLRLATRAENLRNRLKKENLTSKYKGVYWCKKQKKWRAQITTNKKVIKLGSFADEFEAHMAYREAAVKYHGEFANFG